MDANANRASEALRTLEDVARFAIADEALAGGLKRLRHDVAASLGRLPAGWLIANRDTASDIGTTISTDREAQRTGLDTVAIAAAARLGEALRSLEEMAKTVDPTIAREIESVRYRSYDIAAEVMRRTPGHRRQWRVCVLITEALCRRPWRDVVCSVLDGGADAIQVREKSMDGGPLAERVQSIVDLARPLGVSVIVNDRVDVAAACGADGVHLGQSDLAPAAVRRIVGRRLIVGMSTHDAAEADRAIRENADYCGVGAMFPTLVKPSAHRGGVAWLRSYLENYGRIPHLAIGGITPNNVHTLVDAGCRGVAVSSCVCSHEHPERAVAELRRAFDATTVGVNR